MRGFFLLSGVLLFSTGAGLAFGVKLRPCDIAGFLAGVRLKSSTLSSGGVDMTLEIGGSLIIL